ncbi:uncharacterized protein LOC143933354 [Lithobates pipiens]
MQILQAENRELITVPHPSTVRSYHHPSPYIILNPAIPDTEPADYYTTQSSSFFFVTTTDKLLVIMGPSSGFLMVLIGISFILTDAGPVPDTDSECPPDQIYYECGSPCSMMCAKSDPDEPCIDLCLIGCYCKPGFTFEGSDKTKCVPCNSTV